ncbi:unnamed protein product [Amoebophrya sp. A25]|nr:unnamed protein product [Amoebophrya sp. A25]|eukprot:GSA25T00013463001.1
MVGGNRRGGTRSPLRRAGGGPRSRSRKRGRSSPRRNRSKNTSPPRKNRSKNSPGPTRRVRNKARSRSVSPSRDNPSGSGARAVNQNKEGTADPAARGDGCRNTSLNNNKDIAGSPAAGGPRGRPRRSTSSRSRPASLSPGSKVCESKIRSASRSRGRADSRCSSDRLRSRGGDNKPPRMVADEQGTACNPEKKGSRTKLGGPELQGSKKRKGKAPRNAVKRPQKAKNKRGAGRVQVGPPEGRRQRERREQEDSSSAEEDEDDSVPSARCSLSKSDVLMMRNKRERRLMQDQHPDSVLGDVVDGMSTFPDACGSNMKKQKSKSIRKAAKKREKAAKLKNGSRSRKLLKAERMRGGTTSDGGNDNSLQVVAAADQDEEVIMAASGASNTGCNVLNVPPHDKSLRAGMKNFPRIEVESVSSSERGLEQPEDTESCEDGETNEDEDDESASPAREKLRQESSADVFSRNGQKHGTTSRIGAKAGPRLLQSGSTKTNIRAQTEEEDSWEGSEEELLAARKGGSLEDGVEQDAEGDHHGRVLESPSLVDGNGVGILDKISAAGAGSKRALRNDSRNPFTSEDMLLTGVRTGASSSPARSTASVSLSSRSCVKARKNKHTVSCSASTASGGTATTVEGATSCGGGITSTSPAMMLACNPSAGGVVGISAVATGGIMSTTAACGAGGGGGASLSSNIATSSPCSSTSSVGPQGSVTTTASVSGGTTGSSPGGSSAGGEGSMLVNLLKNGKQKAVSWPRGNAIADLYLAYLPNHDLCFQLVNVSGAPLGVIPRNDRRPVSCLALQAAAANKQGSGTAGFDEQESEQITLVVKEIGIVVVIEHDGKRTEKIFAPTTTVQAICNMIGSNCVAKSAQGREIGPVYTVRDLCREYAKGSEPVFLKIEEDDW